MNEAFSRDTVVVASKEQASAELSGEAVILSFKDGVYYGLNEVGAHVWNFIQEPRAIREILDSILAEYDVELDQCEKDLHHLLDDLRGHGLIEIRDGSDS